MIPIEYKPVAQSSIQDLDEEVREIIEEKIKEVRENGIFKHRNVGIVHDEEWGEIWRIKAKNAIANHRVFFDIQDNKMVVLDVLHRDIAYD